MDSDPVGDVTGADRGTGVEQWPLPDRVSTHEPRPLFASHRRRPLPEHLKEKPVPRLRLSFDISRPTFATASSADLAPAMLDICEWADHLGFELDYFCEHHGAQDGYLPSSLAASAAAAGRTRNLRFRPILLTPLYHPIRLAEDLAVIDLL